MSSAQRHDGSRLARRPATVARAGLFASCRAAVPPLRQGVLVLTSLIVAAGALITLPSGEAGAQNADLGRSPFVAVGAAVRPAVVNIRITRAVNASGVDETPLQEMFRRYFPDREGQGGRFENPGTGSGFVVAENGEILTNHHVVAGADRIFVRFSGEQREYEATLVGSDPNTDLALLRIDSGGRRLPHLVFGDSEALQVGDWAIAVGNPFGNLEGTMTVGIVSGKGRGDLVIQGLTPRYQDFIQTDASINFGNSGGPLVDIAGRIIGINTAINSQGQGIGFAVPSRIVQRVYAQLAKNGRVIRGYLGVRTGELVASGRGDGGGARVQVLEVVPGSPAAQAGVVAQDVLVSLGGQAVTSTRQLDFLVAEAEVGGRLPLEIERGGKRQSLQVQLAELTDDAVAVRKEPGHWLGLEVASLASKDDHVLRLRETLGVEAGRGVIVINVEPGQPAAQAGIRPGDVVAAIEGQEIPDLEAFARARDALAARRDPLTLLVRTGNRESFIQVTPRETGTLQ